MGEEMNDIAEPIAQARSLHSLESKVEFSAWSKFVCAEPANELPFHTANWPFWAMDPIPPPGLPQSLTSSGGRPAVGYRYQYPLTRAQPVHNHLSDHGFLSRGIRTRPVPNLCVFCLGENGNVCR